MSGTGLIVFLVLAGLTGLFTITMVIARLYQRASKEISFVRTGMGGQKVVMNGGAIVLPIFQEIIPVNMNTLRLEVERKNEQALITRDRMRVDVKAEFYVRVKPTEEAIADAAQTLGQRTMNPNALKDLVEGKFVDALRAVAAEMAMEELHEQRVEFVQKVQIAVTEDLLKNGLELESVSLTSLDQTDRSYFNPDNAFDAEGLTKLTEEIEARRKLRNDIEQDTEVAIQKKNLDAERYKLDIGKEEEYARLEQQREVENRRAQQSADIAREQAEQQQAAREAQIASERQVEIARIEAERKTEEQRINKERMVETTEIERIKAVKIADQDREIAIANKSKEESEARAQADAARAIAIKATEQVETVRTVAIAEREKQIRLVKAAEDAEQDAIGITVAAEADKKAAIDRAEAARREAEGAADAEKLRAEGAKARYLVDAEGQRNLHEAENVLSSDIIALRVKLALIEHLPSIIAESVRPMEQIDGIKIVQVDGLTGVGGSNGHGGNGVAADGDGLGLADQLVNSALRYRSQAPLVDALLQEIGLANGSLEGLTGVAREITDPLPPYHGRKRKFDPLADAPLPNEQVYKTQGKPLDLPSDAVVEDGEGGE